MRDMSNPRHATAVITPRELSRHDRDCTADVLGRHLPFVEPFLVCQPEINHPQPLEQVQGVVSVGK